jgi:pilus assembly protein FimV
MALFRNNQDAFMRGDINLLRVGVDLVVPTAEELFALDAGAARRQFEDALAGRSVNTSPITDVAGDAQLRIAGGADPATAGVAGTPPSSPDPALRNDLLIVQETTESNRQETAELRSRISELEQQLTDIQRLLSLRNEQLAQLQQTTRAGLPGAGAEPLPTPAPPTPGPEAPLLPPDEIITAAAPDGTDRAPAEPIVEPGIGTVGPDGMVEELLPAPGVRSDAVPGNVASGISEAGDDSTAVAGVQAADAADDPTEASAVPPAEDAGQPLWNAALEGVGNAARAVPVWALATVAGTLGLGGLGLVAYRRRRQLATETASATDTASTDAFGAAPGQAAPVDFQEQPSTADQLELDTLPDLDSDTPLDPGGAGPDKDPAIDGETGLPLNVVSNIQQSQQETQEADVIAEADIYILYGRYREAEALLREELERAPDRPDLKYKLGEALVGSGNRPALAALLDDMRVAGDDARDAARWASLESGLAGLGDAPDADDKPAAPAPRVRAVGNAAPGAGSDPALRDASAGSSELPGDEDTDLGFSVREVSPSSADRLREQMADLELDLQELDAFGGNLESTQVGDGTASPPGYTEDLPGIAPTAAPADLGAPPAPPAVDAPRAGGSRLDLDLDALEELTATPADSAPADLTLPVPDELPTLGVGAGAGTRRGAGAPEDAPADPLAPLPDPLGADPRPYAPVTAADEADHSPAGPPVEDSISSDVLSSQWRMDSGLWDEAGTKMDLARAYIEMEDPDAARTILEEVLQEGSETQRSEASVLLAKLG